MHDTGDPDTYSHVAIPWTARQLVDVLSAWPESEIPTLWVEIAPGSSEVDAHVITGLTADETGDIGLIATRPTGTYPA